MPVPATRLVRFVDVTEPVLVLGSTQPDEPGVEAAGVHVVRRRSGGGAVLVEPGDVVWVDVVVPRDDPLWDDDVGRSFHWLGDLWAVALRDLGVGAGVEVHQGPLVRTPLSPRVCFAGLGPGEVTVGGRKLVGIAQRRTRHGALFQCALVLRWRPDRLGALLGIDAAALEPVARGLLDAEDALDPVDGEVGEEQRGHDPEQPVDVAPPAP